jgi:hypothetical protein
MNHDHFDDVTRGIATGMSRRQALRLLGVGVLSGIGAFFSRNRSQAASVAQDDFSFHFFLPAIIQGVPQPGRPCPSGLPVLCGYINTVPACCPLGTVCCACGLGWGCNQPHLPCPRC